MYQEKLRKTFTSNKNSNVTHSIQQHETPETQMSQENESEIENAGILTGLKNNYSQISYNPYDN